MFHLKSGVDRPVSLMNKVSHITPGFGHLFGTIPKENDPAGNRQGELKKEKRGPRWDPESKAYFVFLFLSYQQSRNLPSPLKAGASPLLCECSPNSLRFGFY